MQAWCKRTQRLFQAVCQPAHAAALKPQNQCVDCVSAAYNCGKKIGTTGPFPGTFTGSVELSSTPTITILCRSLFLNLLAVYLAISPSPVILFCPLCLSAHLYLSHIPTQHYPFKSFEDNRQPSSVFLSLTHSLAPKLNEC